MEKKQSQQTVLEGEASQSRPLSRSVTRTSSVNKVIERNSASNHASPVPQEGWTKSFSAYNLLSPEAKASGKNPRVKTDPRVRKKVEERADGSGDCFCSIKTLCVVM